MLGRKRGSGRKNKKALKSYELQKDIVDFNAYKAENQPKYITFDPSEEEDSYEEILMLTLSPMNDEEDSIDLLFDPDDWSIDPDDE